MVVKIQVKPNNVNVNLIFLNTMKKNQSQVKKGVVKNWRLFIKEHILSYH